MSRSPLAARSFFRDPVGYVQAHDGEAPVLRLAAPQSQFLLVRDPETIWRVLVAEAGRFRQGKWKRRSRRFLGLTLNSLDGDGHRFRRRALVPSLSRSRVAGFTASIVSRSTRVQAGWEEGLRVRLRDNMEPMSLGIAGEVLLSTELEPQAAELAQALSTVMEAVPRLTPPLPGSRAGRALARVNRAVGAIVAQRRRATRHSDDLLGALLATGLPEQAVSGELIFFLLAAVEEPPSALEAAWYLLARHPAAEQRFHAELDEVLGDRSPVAGDEDRLQYLDAVVRETLRLFPPARHIDRCPVGDVQIGDGHLRAGSDVILSPLVTHREASLYERPSAFMPERWLGADRRVPPRGAYFPFGAGAHACMGQALARAIITFTLATIGRRWRLRLDVDPAPPGPRAPRLVFNVHGR